MSDDNDKLSALDRFRRRSTTEQDALPPAMTLAVSNEETGEDRRKCFSLVRGVKGRIFMLELRFRAGDRLALGYPYFMGMEFDASGVLRLFFSGYVVNVTGRNLAPLYEGLLDHAVGYLQELDEDYDQLPPDEPFILSIQADRIE